MTPRLLALPVFVAGAESLGTMTVRLPWVSIPGPFGTRTGHRLQAAIDRR